MARINTAGRLTALALATGTLVVAAVGSAGAAPVVIPDVFGGSARGTAIHIEVNLPVALPLPGIGNVQSIIQDISLTEGTASKELTKLTSVAKAVLGNGSIAPLNLVSEASLSGDKQSDSKSLVEIPANPLIHGGVGTITSSVSPEGTSSALTSTSSSSLASLRIGLGALPSLPLKTELGDVTETLQNTVDTAEGTVNAAVTNALAVLNDVSGGATAPVQAQVEAVQGQLTTLLDALQGTLGNLTADTDLVRLSLLESTNTITRKGEQVESRATSSIGGLDVLAGLIKVDAVKTESFSIANGKKGAAAADTLTTVLGLKVADVLDLRLTDRGLEGSVLGNTLPPAAQDAVNTVISSVNGLLATAGVNIVYGKTTKSIDPAGQSAASSSEGVGIVVNPPALGLAKPLLAVQLVPAGTAVNAARLAKPTVPTITPTKNPPLARTGASQTIAIVGAGLVGTAMVARRRRTAQV